MGRELKIIAATAIAILLTGTGVLVGYQWAHKKIDTKAAAMPATSERKALYWYDPMMPNQHFDKPGKSPFMDMQLVPKYADDSGEPGGIRVSAATQQTLGIRIAAAERRSFENSLTVAGTIGFNEREVAIVQARTSGFVSRVYARAPGDVIARGAALVDVVVPEWAAAQQEFIALRNSGDAALIDAARERLRLLGITDAVVRRIERTGEAQTAATITAPIAGAIQSLDVREGMAIATGATLAQINALDTVWLTASVPEAAAANIDIGDRVTALLPALGDAKREGRVIAVLPQADTATRTLSVRIALKNADGRLRPGQYAQVQLHTASIANALVVPSEAIIRSGKRAIVIVADGERFTPIEIQSGREHGGVTEIDGGLAEGQQVVVSGQFLIDSEANLSGALARMNNGSNADHGGHR